MLDPYEFAFEEIEFGRCKSGTPRGAKASATIYSIIETAKENSLNPLLYLTYLFEKLPNLEDPKDPVALD